jgi:hypothetical protein
MRNIILFLIFAVSAGAQTISPPVVSYSSTKASDVFVIKNVSETAPLLVTGLSAETFTVDQSGNPTFVKLDPSKIRLKLSENSVRIPPLGAHEFYAEMKCLQPGPCWASIYVSIAQGRAANGIAVSLLLPHTIYLGQGSVRKKEAQVRFINRNSFEIANDGDGLDRPQVEVWNSAGKVLSGVPIFPHYSRVVTSETPIEKIRIKFTKFTINEKQ